MSNRNRPVDTGPPWAPARRRGLPSRAAVVLTVLLSAAGCSFIQAPVGPQNPRMARLQAMRRQIIFRQMLQYARQRRGRWRPGGFPGPYGPYPDPFGPYTPEERPVRPSPIELKCERIPPGLPKVRLRNLTGRPLEVSLHGLIYYRQIARLVRGRTVRYERWMPVWEQYGIRLPPRGTWSAQIYSQEAQRLAVRDRRGRLLGEMNWMRRLPRDPWPTAQALHSDHSWRPFVRAEAFGQTAPMLFYPGRSVTWRTITPAKLPARRADFEQPFTSAVCVIGDIGAEALTGEQMAGLRAEVERGRTLIICGGADRARLAGWGRVGLLAAPVRGVRTVSGLRALAQRYGVRELAAPIRAADVGAVLSPARVLLEEDGVPLVVERRIGAGTLLLVTFDPTRPPFRGSPVEKAFWQEWTGRLDPTLGISPVVMGQAKTYEQLCRKLRLPPPPAAPLVGFWAAYLAVLGLALVSRRRIPCLVTVSLGGFAAALALAPVLRGSKTVAAFAGVLALRSRDAEGMWMGDMEMMSPQAGLVTLRIRNGAAYMTGRTPAMRVLDSPYLTIQPRLERWTPVHAWVSATEPIHGAVRFEVELRQDGVFVEAENRTRYVLKDAAVLWGGNTRVRLGDLLPGGRTRRRIASVDSSGQLSGVREKLPPGYGPRSNFGFRPEYRPLPILLARCTAGPLPELLADDQPVSKEGYLALVVSPSGLGLHGGFRLPPAATTARVVRLVRASTRVSRVFWQRRGLPIGPDGQATLELLLPSGAGRARWKALRLRVDGGAGSAFRVQLFDRAQRRWASLGLVRRQSPFALSSPERFMDRQTDALLVRLENASGVAAAVRVEVSGEGEAP